ncbi:MAG: YbjN domain-containing protein [Erythrobacter sp.]
MNSDPANSTQTDLLADETAAPIEMLAALFEARGWPCEVTPQGEVTSEVQGSWTKYQLRAIWRHEDNVLQLLCFPDIRLSEPKRSATYELLSLINEQVWIGHFDIWSNGDVLLYRHGAMLGADGLLSLEQAQSIVETAIDECDRFYPAFQFVMWGDKAPRDALESAMVDAAGEA